MSDGPTKVDVALDEIILGEDGVGPEPGPPPPTPLDVPPPKKPSARPKDGDPSNEPRKRAKMTLRIPDDEVSRPNLPPGTPPLGVAAIADITRAPSSPDDGATALPPVAPGAPVPGGAPGAPTTLTARSPISPDDTVEIPPERPEKPASPGVDVAHEPGWTVDPPVVAERRTDPDLSATLAAEPAPLASEDIPIDTDLGSEDLLVAAAPSMSEMVTSPRLPASPEPQEIRISDGDRVSDVGDAPEIEVEDLVSVESLPRPPQQPVAPLPPRVSGSPPPSPVAPAALAPVAAAVVAASQPRPKMDSVPPAGEIKPPPVPPAPPAPPKAAYASSPPAARHPPAAQQAHLIVPSAGALAPPPLSEGTMGRKKTRPWWEELFNDDFVRTMAKIKPAAIESEVDFIEESLGCESGAMILDLGCGTGEHCVSLSKRGYQVVGFDLSLSMLARAADEAQESNQKLNFVQGDMRDMTFEETFDGVYSWNTSFGFFDEEKNAQVVERVRRSLKKGGQFLLDVVNRDFVIRQAPSLAWYEGDGCICMDEMTVDFITSRMRVKRTLMLDDGRTKEIEYSIRLYSLHELGKLLHDNGFRVAEVSGLTATPGVFFGCESPRTLILAEKR